MEQKIENTLEVGAIVDSGKVKYRIEKVLGQGGFGITYKVTASKMDGNIPIEVTYALKEFYMKDFSIRDHNSGAVISTAKNFALSRKAFLSEARRLASIKHKNIVAVNEVFEANNTAYYVMQYLEGESLYKYLGRKGALPVSEAMCLMSPIFDAVDYLHKNKFTHLDIKPDNIMLSKNRAGEMKPMLIDFGLSKHYDAKGNETSVLQQICVSPGYSPFEQYGGIHTFTPQADVYALAATLYHCLTGSVPPNCNDYHDAPKSMLQVIAKGLENVDTPVREAILSAMEVKAERTQSVASFVSHLAQSAAAHEIVENPDVIIENPITEPINPGTVPINDPNQPRPPKPARPRWLAPLLIALGVLVVGVLTVFFMNPFDPAPAPNPNPIDTTVLNDTIVTPAVPAASAVDVVDGSVDDGYSVAYAGALNLYNSRKYSDCKRECQKLLRQYTSREQKEQLNQLIEYCDTALAAEEEAQQQATQQSAQQQPATPATSSGGSSSNLPDKAVDLGLSVLWADRNVGASSPSDYGGYYAWGETSTKSNYTWDTYQYDAGSDGCVNIGSNISGTRYDVARQKWGGGWKMPTKAQWQELLNRCTWTWTSQGGHNGYKVTGPNGNSIFLPAAGYRYGTSSNYVGSYGSYWSSTLSESNPYSAWDLYFGSGSRDVNYGSRNYGRTVRPVTEK